MKIGIIGGSNSAWKKGYVHYLRENSKVIISNYAIGGVNNVYGLVQLVKHSICEKNDLLIYEYMVNDINRHHLFKNDVERTKKSLVEIINICAKTNTKLMLIYLYPKNMILSGEIETCPMCMLYKKFASEYELTVLDVSKLLQDAFGKEWLNYYEDNLHPNEAGRKALANSVLNILKDTTIPNFIENEIGFEKPKIIQIKDYLPSKNYKNSLVNTNYVEIFNELKIEFKQKSTLILIEYADSGNSGFIEIGNNNKKVYKSAIIRDRNPNSEKFEKLYGKTIVSNLSLNQHCIEDENILTIKNIPYSMVNPKFYDTDKEKWEWKENQLLHSMRGKTQFNLISLFLSNDAEISNITVT